MTDYTKVMEEYRAAIEPCAVATRNSCDAMTAMSLAISAKRQADALERIAELLSASVGPYGGFQVEKA